MAERGTQALDALWDATVARFTEAAAEVDGLTLESVAKEIYENETKRRETLENKASALVQSAGIVASIITVAASVLDQPWRLPFRYAILAAFLYLIPIVYLVTAIRYAAKARQLGAYASLTAASFDDIIPGDPVTIKNRLAVQMLAQAKWNEHELQLKVNNLSASEILYSRGMAFFALAIFVSIAAKILAQFLQHC